MEHEQPSLLRLARRLVWDGEEARELVQAALVLASLADAYEKRRALRAPGAGPAWLRRILVSRALGHLRRRRPRLRGLAEAAVRKNRVGLMLQVKRLLGPESWQKLEAEMGQVRRMVRFERRRHGHGGPEVETRIERKSPPTVPAAGPGKRLGPRPAGLPRAT